MSKVAIIGSGIMGRVLAIELAKTSPELHIDIYDKSLSYKRSCSYCAGGMLSPLSELITCEKHAYEIGHNSYELWSNINSFINNYLNTTNTFVKEADTYVIAHIQDRYELNLAIRNINLRVAKLSESLKQKVHTDFKVCEKQNILSKEQGISLSNSISDKVIKLNEALISVPEFFNLSEQFFKEYKNIKTLELSKQNFYAKHLDTSYQQIFDCTGFPNNQLDNL